MLILIIQIVYCLLLIMALAWVSYRLAKAFSLSRLDVDQQATTLNSEALPTVSVCIPVRNEAKVIEGVLTRVLASDYPKLEIIVLDDESVDNTSDMIKLMAHKGIRFIPAGPLPDGWIGKNHALDELYRQSTGEYVLFLSADTRISPKSISKLVNFALKEKAQMVSVLPMRDDSPRRSVFFGSLRYFLELLFHSPFDPAFSTACWLIERNFLNQVDGLKAYKDNFVAEATLAQAVQSFGQYRFLTSSKELGIAYRKRWRSQVKTAIRSNYHIMKNISFASFVYAGLFLFWTGPIVALVTLLINKQSVFGWTVTGLAMLSGLLYAVYCSVAWNRLGVVGFLTWPVVVFQELVTMLVSIYRHKYRKTIIWKGRDISKQPMID